MDSFGNDFGRFWNFENIFFENFRRLDLPWKTAQKFFEKIVQITIKTRLDSFGNDFGRFWNFEFFFDFFENFLRFETPWKTGQKFSKSLPQNTFKTRLDTFGNDFGPFWNFQKKFWKIFENSTFHGKLGKNFSKKLSKLQSKHVWILLGTILGVLGNLKLF